MLYDSVCLVLSTWVVMSAFLLTLYSIDSYKYSICNPINTWIKIGRDKVLLSSSSPDSPKHTSCSNP